MVLLLLAFSHDAESVRRREQFEVDVNDGPAIQEAPTWCRGRPVHLCLTSNFVSLWQASREGAEFSVTTIVSLILLAFTCVSLIIAFIMSERSDLCDTWNCFSKKQRWRAPKERQTPSLTGDESHVTEAEPRLVAPDSRLGDLKWGVPRWWKQEWKHIFVELNEGRLRWWVVKEGESWGGEPDVTLHLLGFMVQEWSDEGIFKIKTEASGGTVYAFKCENGAEAHNWVEELCTHSQFCDEVGKFEEAKIHSSVARSQLLGAVSRAPSMCWESNTRIRGHGATVRVERNGTESTMMTRSTTGGEADPCLSYEVKEPSMLKL